MTRSHTDIPLFKDVAQADWDDWHWQLRNRLTTTADFDQVLNLDDKQRADLDACMGKFRVSVALLCEPHRPGRPARPRAHASRADAP
jgi:lysine 2,3-aminomutase